MNKVVEHISSIQLMSKATTASTTSANRKFMDSLYLFMVVVITVFGTAWALKIWDAQSQPIY